MKLLRFFIFILIAGLTGCDQAPAPAPVVTVEEVPAPIPEPVPEPEPTPEPKPEGELTTADGRYPTFAAIVPLLDRYCFECHGDGEDKGDFTFGEFVESDSGDHMILLEKAMQSIRDESMPNEKAEEQLAATDRTAMLRSIEDYMTGVIAARPPDPGRGIMRRLTRYEYRATVRDLFYGFPFDPAVTFPEEDRMMGFDVVGQTQTIDLVLGEKFMAAADGVLNVVFPTPGVNLSVALPPSELKRIQDAILFVRPSKDITHREAAAQVVRRFASRAFRRRVEPERVERFLTLYDKALAGGAPNFDTCVKVALKGVLISPEFLLRVESDPNIPEGPLAVPVNDYELASRLSYFLWSSMPDDELFALATQDKLSEPATLEAQVRRMLLDTKARALAENFVRQWLDLDALEKASPSSTVFPEFDNALRASLRMEPIYFFAAIIREDRSVLEMLDSDYAFLNHRLAQHYGIPGVAEGDALVKVSLPNPQRGGILGMGAVLLGTSYDTRTSVSHRGQWVLDRILGTPPPPAPMNVPPLPDNPPGEPPKTLRERLEQHATDAACAGCHSKVDPAGFALESYDAIGRWRTEDAGKPLDTVGRFTDGSQADGPIELKKLLLEKQRLFLENLARQTLTYALGRAITFQDRPYVLATADALEQDPRFSTLIMQVVKSVPFLCRRNVSE